MNDACDSVQLGLFIARDDNIQLVEMSLFLNEFNSRWRYINAYVGRSGIITVRLDFLVDESSSVGLFKRYHTLYGHFVNELYCNANQRFATTMPR